MKKLSKIFILVLLTIAFIISNFSVVKADSGWDGSYGGGGSTGGWSSGGSHGGGWSSGGNHRPSSGGHGGKSTKEDIYTAVVTFGVVVIIIAIVYISQLKKSANFQSSKSPLPDTTTTPVSINLPLSDKVKRILPNFDEKRFIDQAYEIYKDIQVAWMDFDYETLRKLTTDELYNLYHSQLVALSVKKQKNIMKDFKLFGAKITNVEHNNASISIKINMQIECTDYVIDKNEKVVRGDANDRMFYNYEMTFTKGLNEKDNKCPNCNAPLENVHSSVCPYCNSTIISDNHNWVLSKKQMLNQSIK